MTAVLTWLRLDLRRRWRSLAVLALLLALASGTVLASVAGARRADSALPRLGATTLPATAVVLPNQPGFDWARVRAMPEVEALTTFLLPDVELSLAGIGGNAVGFPPGDDELFRTIERPVLLQGRLPDPERADEVTASTEFLRIEHKAVGDTVVLPLYTPAQVKAAAEATSPVKPAGPRVQLRIVGVVRSPWFHDEEGGRGGVQPSPGLFTAYRANLWDQDKAYANALVRLRGGEQALTSFQAHLAAVTGRTDIDVWHRAEQLGTEQHSISFQSRSLLAFAAAALVAALFLVGQAIARYTAASVADLHVLGALGMTPGQAVGAAAAGPLLAALAGATAGAGAAAGASRWFPIGTAAFAEPSPGWDLDPIVLGLGWVAVPLLVLAGSCLAAFTALRAAQRSSSTRMSSVAVLMSRAGLPVPVVVGTRFALETGRGRSAVPVRPALFGAVAGVLGVLGAFTFSSGVADAASNPARYGQTWQLEAFFGLSNQDFGPVDKVLAALAADPDVVAVNDARIAVAHAGPSAKAISLFTLAPARRPLEVVLTSGRLPASASEVVLAPTPAADIGARLGSRVDFTGSQRRRQSLTVVGLGFVPSSPHNNYDGGGWLTPAGYRSLFERDFKFHTSQISVRPGTDLGWVQARLNRAVVAHGAGHIEVGPPPWGSPLASLRRVQQLPVVLGIFLMLLALGAIGHALATAVRRRRHDVAVLRALGMTRRQSRGLLLTQASVLAVVGLIFGVPLGVALGRTVWRVVADYTPLQYASPVALLALLLVGPLALLLANLLAAWPGHQAARLRIGHVLRAE